MFYSLGGYESSFFRRFFAIWGNISIVIGAIVTIIGAIWLLIWQATNGSDYDRPEFIIFICMVIGTVCLIGMLPLSILVVAVLAFTSE